MWWFFFCPVYLSCQFSVIRKICEGAFSPVIHVRHYFCKVSLKKTLNYTLLKLKWTKTQTTLNQLQLTAFWKNNSNERKALSINCLLFICIITENLKILTPRLKQTLWRNNNKVEENGICTAGIKSYGLNFTVRTELNTRCPLFYRTLMQELVRNCTVIRNSQSTETTFGAFKVWTAII